MKYGSRAPMAGNYVRLIHLHETIMSNTWAEIADHLPFIRRATGNVLINGLGLGMCIEAILGNKEVKSITVIEKSEDVIKLVAPTYLTDSRVKIIHADAFEYQPPKGVRYNAVWHDIWPSITSENLPEMFILHRKYARKTDWQGSWSRPQAESMRRRDRRYAF
jgi:hypothetical protein